MHLTKPIPAGPTPKTWSRDEYYRLADCGWFQNERTELIAGRIYVVSPQSFLHAAAVDCVAKLLHDRMGETFWVRSQLPLFCSADSEPEPDVSVVRGTRSSYDDHPRTAVLIVEVSNTSLAFDRADKASLYASFGIEDYWIINLVDRVLEVHRDPDDDDQQPFSHTYRNVQTLQPTDKISPLAASDSKISVGDLLPHSKASPER